MFAAHMLLAASAVGCAGRFRACLELSMMLHGGLGIGVPRARTGVSYRVLGAQPAMNVYKWY